MKTRKLAVALFSCALLSTAYVSNEMGKMAQTKPLIERSIASEAKGAINPAGDPVVEKPFYIVWKEKAADFGDKVSEVWNGIDLIDFDVTLRPSVLKEKVDTIAAEYEVLKKDRNNIEEQLNQEKKKSKDLKEELDLTNEHTSKMVNGLLDDLDAQKESYEQDIEVLKDKSNKLAKALEVQNGKVAELEMALAQFDDITTKLKELRDRIAQLESENKELKDENQRLTCLLEKQSDLEEQVKELTADKAEILAKLEEQLKKEDGEEVVAASEEKKEESNEEVTAEKKEEKQSEVVAESKPEKKASDESDDEDEKEDKKEKKVAKKDSDDESYEDKLLGVVTAYLQQQAEIQQRNQFYQFQMSQAGRRDQMSLMNDMVGFEGGNSFLNSQLMMMKDIEMMRMRSRMMDRYRLESGGFFGNDYGFDNYRSNRNDSYFGLNTGRNMSFHDQYIKNQPMRYNQADAFPLSHFNSERAYDFRQNVSPNFAETQSWEPSSVSFN